GFRVRGLQFSQHQASRCRRYDPAPPSIAVCANGSRRKGGAGVKQVLITGGRGFLGRNLAVHLSDRKDCAVTLIDCDDSADALRRALADADIVFHLAGVNRPQHVSEFDTGNAGSTEVLVSMLRENGRTPKIVLSSSIQAALDNPYGASKARAEQVLRQVAAQCGA